MKKVLVVDDDREFLSVLEDVLTVEGYIVFCAVNGAEALRTFIYSRPDLVLLDNNMPKLTGIETLKAIRTLNYQVPVIMLTALLDDEFKMEAYRCGANDFMSKPPDFPLLVKTISATLNMAHECS